VPHEQAKMMISALEKVGRTPEGLFIPQLGHSYGNARQRVQISGRSARSGKELGRECNKAGVARPLHGS